MLSPEEQIAVNQKSETLIKSGLCPYCHPTKTAISHIYEGRGGYAFRCKIHGRCGCTTKTLNLASIAHTKH